MNAVLYLYTPEIYPTRMRAIGTGAATCWLRLASAAGPLLVGYLVAVRGTGAVFLMFAGAGVIGAVAALGMLETQEPQTRRVSSITVRALLRAHACAQAHRCPRQPADVSMIGVGFQHTVRAAKLLSIRHAQVPTSRHQP